MQTAGLLVLSSLLVMAAAAVEPGTKPRHVVVVLPFRVHSAKPIEYLGESISNLIRSRLQSRGEVRVLEMVPEEEEGGYPVTDADLRRVAETLGADTVVSGSLTELAGHYSLDARVTPAAVGLRSHTLVLTAQRDDEILARVNELADQVLEQIVGAKPAHLAEVQLIGPPELVEALEGSLRTRIGDLYDPVAIRDDLAMLRGHSKVANAQVQTERGPDGVSVNFQIVAKERGFIESSSQPGVGVRVSEIRIRGNRRIESDAIQARIKTQAGSPYSPKQIAMDLSAVHALGFFKNVRVFREVSAEGVIVTFEVEENPTVRQISISGNDNLDGDNIRDILTLTTGSSLDYPLLYHNRERIEALYRNEGYYLAEVNFEIGSLGEASVSIDFIVIENKKLKLREIRFVGNEEFSDRELREGFKTKPWRFWSIATSWFDRSGVYSEALFYQDVRLVEKKYNEKGYLRVEIKQPEVFPTEEGLTVTLEIREGDQYRVGAIDVAGDATLDLEHLREMLMLKDGEVFNRTYLTDDVDRLRDYYTERGFFSAEVTPLSDYAETGQAVDVVFQVRKGPLYFVREIGVSGNTRTVDAVIRREVAAVEGQLYSSRAIRLSETRLNQLGFFEEIEITPEPTDNPQEIDLEVQVVERPTGSFSFGVGFSSQDAFVATGSISEANLFGRGYRLNFSADFGSRTQRFYLQFADRHVFGSDYSMSGTIFRTSTRFQDFEDNREGIDFAVGRSLSEDNRVSGSVHYGLSRRDVTRNTNVNSSAVVARELLLGEVTSSTVGFQVVADYRNDRLSPTDGFQLEGGLEYSGMGFTTNFLRAEGGIAYFVPAPSWLLDRSTFMFRTRMGYAYSFNELSDFNFDLITTGFVGGAGNGEGELRSLDLIDTDLTLPLTDRYYLGGLGEFQLRGFKGRTVGPRRPILRQVFVTVQVPDDDEIPGEAEFIVVPTGTYTPVGRADDGTCPSTSTCNTLDGPIENYDQSDVIGGNKFITTSIEYRFPIADKLGLQGLAFLDTGNAFAEGDALWDIDDWRWGTGVGLHWFSPFGPLTAVIGWPLDPLPVDNAPVFEFSVGGSGL